MNEPRKGVPVVKTAAALLFGAFLIIICIPNFVRATHQTATNACLNNLRILDGAKEQWSLEKGKTNGEMVTEADLATYLEHGSNGNFPKCPNGGNYILGRIGEDPKCSIGSSAWPNNHELSEHHNWWTDFKAAYMLLLNLKFASTNVTHD